MNNTFLELYSRIREYLPLGSKETKFANLIGKAPHIGKEAWLHSIYKPLSEKEIIELDKNLDVKIPKAYKDFLLVCNGLSIFGTTLSLFGYRFNYIRDLDNIYQPFNILTANAREKPNDAMENHFFFGFYNWDGSNLFIDVDTNKVYRCMENSMTILNKWENLEDMLLSEIERLVDLFDMKGVKKDENKETTPARLVFDS